MAYDDPMPLSDLADILPIQSVSWTLVPNQQISMAGSGELLAADLAPALWSADVTLAELDHATARRLRARFNTLDGSLRTFYLYDPLGKYPAGDPTGAILGSSTPTIYAINANRKAMRIAGVPEGYDLTEGDMLAIDYGSPARRALIEISSPAVADASGITGEFEVRPYLRPGITTTTTVQLVKPSARMKLVPGSFRIATASVTTSQIAFRARQSLAAGS